MAARTQIILTTRFLPHAVVHPGVFQWPRREGGPAWCFPGVCAWRTWSDRCYILLMSPGWGRGLFGEQNLGLGCPGSNPPSAACRVAVGRSLTHSVPVRSQLSVAVTTAPA